MPSPRHTVAHCPQNKYHLTVAHGDRGGVAISQGTTNVPQLSKPEVRFSAGGADRLMDRSNGAPGSASKCKPLQAEVIRVVDQVEVSIPLATAADFWNLAQGSRQ